jgi:hypothetical protein
MLFVPTLRTGLDSGKGWENYFKNKKILNAKSSSVEMRLRKSSYHPPSKLLLQN